MPSRYSASAGKHASHPFSLDGVGAALSRLVGLGGKLAQVHQQGPHQEPAAHGHGAHGQPPRRHNSRRRSYLELSDLNGRGGSGLMHTPSPRRQPSSLAAGHTGRKQAGRGAAPGAGAPAPAPAPTPAPDPQHATGTNGGGGGGGWLGWLRGAVGAKPHRASPGPSHTHQPPHSQSQPHSHAHTHGRIHGRPRPPPALELGPSFATAPSGRTAASAATPYSLLEGGDTLGQGPGPGPRFNMFRHHGHHQQQLHGHPHKGQQQGTGGGGGGHSSQGQGLGLGNGTAQAQAQAAPLARVSAGGSKAHGGHGGEGLERTSVQHVIASMINAQRARWVGGCRGRGVGAGRGVTAGVAWQRVGLLHRRYRRAVSQEPVALNTCTCMAVAPVPSPRRALTHDLGSPATARLPHRAKAMAANVAAHAADAAHTAAHAAANAVPGIEPSGPSGAIEPSGLSDNTPAAPVSSTATASASTGGPSVQGGGGDGGTGGRA